MTLNKCYILAQSYVRVLHESTLKRYIIKNTNFIIFEVTYTYHLIEYLYEVFEAVLDAC